MASLNPSFNEMQLAISDALGAHWKLFLFQGVVIIILGVLAVAARRLQHWPSTSMSVGSS